MNIKNMEFGDAVKFVRMKLGLSQTELAKAIGVSLPTVSRWENKGRKPQMMTLGKFYEFCRERGIDFGEVDSV